MASGAWIDAEGDEFDLTYGVGKWHCDDIWHHKAAPDCVLKFLDIARAPAHGYGRSPELYAMHDGVPCRVTMASRFGDVGISFDLSKTDGYDKRVFIPELSEFKASK